jgi:hypothetical protein
MRKLSILIFLMFSLLLSGMTQASSIDVTGPGDTIKGVPDDPTAWPDAEAPPYVIDNNPNTKYLNFRGATETTGFQVTASLGGMIVNEITFTTGNDAPERDPVTFELYGSNDSIDGPYTLIASGDVVDFNEPNAWPRNTKNETPVVFDNDVAYDHYQVLFTALRVPENGCCMQISEVELLSTVPDLTGGWYYKDIGTTGGNAWEDANTFIIRADGADIWGENDGFGYMFRPMEGDGVITANLVSMSMDTLHDWAKAGVMIRETTEANSKHATLLITGANGAQFGYRMDTGGGTTDGGTWGLQEPPKELTIERVGNTFTITYWHVEIPDLFEYWQSESIDIPMNEDVLIGLAVTSHDIPLLTAVYDNVTWPADPYNKAWEMRPLDGATKVPLQPTLTWMPGENAVTHDVYLGTDPAALDPVATGLVDESYTPDTPLAGGTVYYWQIVEQPGDYASPVLSFKTTRTYTGTILREIWEGIGGTNISDLTSNPDYPNNPTWSDELTRMGYYDFADNYGARMQGYIVPEISGDYTFWIAGDDSIELWLSSDEVSCNAEKIAEHIGWTNAHQWFDAAVQQSDPIPLVANQKYFIRALHKEGGGGDNCQVAWYGPDQPNWPVAGSDSAVIDGYYLMPADDPYAGNPNPANGFTGTVHEAETVSWAAGKGAISHDVYLGTDPGAMSLVATVAMPDTSCTLPALAVDQTYYWKVDAYDGTDTYSGCPWSFNTVEWVSIDIGRANPIPAGSSSYDPITGEYTLKAGGNELWGTADEFHYLYTTMKMTRDTGEIKARVLSIVEPDSWRRAGVQIRETRAPNARKVNAHKTGHDCTRMHWREQPGWDTWGGPEIWGLGFPMWVRITRDHDQFETYYSYDDQNWTHMGSAWVPMEAGNYVCVGLSLCHHNSVDQAALTTATLDNLSITTPDPLQSWGPSPRNGEQGVGLDVTLSWGAGEGADEHRLYFSDNYEDVYYGLVDPVVLPAGTTEYSVGVLDLTKGYYWAVDEMIVDGRDVSIILGDVWSFRVEDFRLMDDFESYDPVPEPLPEQIVIEDGYIIPGDIISPVEPPAENLLAEYVFEGNYNDTSGSGFDGIPVGDANIIDDAERGLVLSLGGDLDYVDCNNPAELNFATGNWSLSAWVKNTMTGTGDDNKGSIIANGGDGGGGHRYCLVVSEQEEGRTTLVTDNDVDKMQALSTTPVNDGVWRHVLGVRDGDTTRIYIDGVEEGSAGLPADYDLSGTSQANVLIGAMTLASDGSIYKTYAGLIDDVRIYNCAMTEENIRWLADLGDLVIPDVCVPPVYGPLIAEYLVELPDPTADTSGNNLHGTPLGDVTVVDDAVRGYVASFDGNGDAVNIGNNERFNPESGDLSISTWINMSSYGDSWGNVIVGKRGEGGLGWQLRRLSDTQRISFTTRNCGDQDGWGPGGQNVSLNEWHHVAAVRQGLQKWLYIDGVQEALSDICDYIEPCVHDVYIGARANGDNTGPESFFNGMIDDLRIYETALTYGEVLNLMEYTPTTLMSDTWSGTGATTLTLDYYEPHWGDNSMMFAYNGCGVAKRIAPFTNWYAGQGKAIALWFKGDPGNEPGEMYVQLPNKGKAIYDGAPEDLMNSDWQEWNINLDTFGLPEEGEETPGEMCIGILGGGGVLRFDDIRLYPSRCRAEFGPMTDLTGDCLVDAKDLRILIGEWLEGDYTLNAIEPDVSGLLAHYEFEGDLSDSSGNDNDGTIVGDANNFAFEDDPEMGMVLSLPGGSDQYVNCDTVGNSGNVPVSIACWAKADHTNIPDWTLVFGFTGTDTGEGGNGSHFNVGSIGGPGGMGAHVWGWEDTIFPDEETLVWRHYAMTYNGNYKLTYYGDGIQVGQVNLGFDLSLRADRVHIGSRITQDSSFPGKVDDARIYNYELSVLEVMSLAGVDELYVPLESNVNFYDEEPMNSKKINFMDYAVMMEEWLYEQLWP